MRHLFSTWRRGCELGPGQMAHVLGLLSVDCSPRLMSTSSFSSFLSSCVLLAPSLIHVCIFPCYAAYDIVCWFVSPSWRHPGSLLTGGHIRCLEASGGCRRAPKLTVLVGWAVDLPQLTHYWSRAADAARCQNSAPASRDAHTLSSVDMN